MAAEQSVDAGEDPRKGRGRKGRKATAIEAAAWVKAGVRHTHPCGNGVYLQVTRPGVASWLFRFSVHGRRCDLGLGSYGDVKLSEAFAKAAEAALLVRAGRDPVAEKRGAKQAAAVEARAAEMNAAKAAAAALTFRDVALDYICDHRAAWENRQHRWQWEATLEKHVFPVIGGLHPSEITVDHVLQVLRPIWNTTNETASRVRGRIETILSVAKVRKLRSGENPAAWRDNLALLLPKPGDVKVRHHPALPWKRMPEFMRDAERRQGRLGAWSASPR